jgi:gamma-D-glutamyl-L-lysine dipeptidyl-peptidase
MKVRASLLDAAALVEAVRSEYAPDPRLAVFELAAEEEGDALVLTGATSEAVAAEELLRRVAARDQWREVRDQVQRLPEATGEDLVHAVVCAGLAPMHAGPRVAETQVSQVVLGNRMVVLRRSGRWLQCRAGDGYIGWVHAGYVALMDETAARAWEMGAGGETWISLGAEVRDPSSGETLVRLPWGARVLREADGRARLPDARVGEVHGEVVPAAMRPLSFPSDGAAMCQTAARWLGVPYLWGGVTLGGVDCSGFVQALHRLHGVVIPRDSDQQSRGGQPVEPVADFEALRAGDLLFFAEEPGRVTHVAMSIGGSRIIHASLGNGGVARNDVAGRRSYERELRRIFVCARRFT